MSMSWSRPGIRLQMRPSPSLRGPPSAVWSARTTFGSQARGAPPAPSLQAYWLMIGEIRENGRLRSEFCSRAGASAIERSVFDHPAHQFVKRDAGVLRHLRHQRGFGHSRLGIHFKADQALRTGKTVIVAKVGAGDPTAAKRTMRGECRALDFFVYDRGDRRRQQVLGAAWRIFGFVVVKLYRGHDLDHAEGPVAHDSTGELLARDVGLDKNPIAESAVGACQFLRRMPVILATDVYADAGACCQRLDNLRRRQQMALCHFRARRNHPSRHGNAGSLQHHLGGFLLHRERRREHTRMSVWNAKNFEHALQHAIFARTTVQYIERSIGFERTERCSDFAIDVDPADPIAGTLESVSACL